MQSRFHTLDYLRGLAALSIMLYHYAGFVYGHFEADTLLGRLGVYGVSIFYILSGLTLYLVYNKRWDNSLVTIKEFALKRVFRIFPLMWAVVLGAVLLNGQIPNIEKLALNLTGLFGFIRPTAYLSMGMWSIGNELVFYAFFPVLMFLLKKHSSLFLTFVAALCLVYGYFAFSVLDQSKTLAEQWGLYINPLNQVALFALGVVMGYCFKKVTVSVNGAGALLLLGAAAFVFYPTEGDAINLVAGVNRIAFTAIMAVICFSFYKLPVRLPNWIHKPLTLLGEVSYGVYLLHPLVWSAITFALGIAHIEIPILLKLAFAVPVTFILSYLVYNYFEKYFIKLGKRFTQPPLSSIRVEKLREVSMKEVAD